MTKSRSRPNKSNGANHQLSSAIYEIEERIGNLNQKLTALITESLDAWNELRDKATGLYTKARSKITA